MKFYDNKGNDGAVSSVDYNIWFKPFYVATIQIGNWTTNLNQETIDYSNTATDINTDGYALCNNSNGFEFDVFFTTPFRYFTC